jgi:hypothetical protein
MAYVDFATMLGLTGLLIGALLGALIARTARKPRRLGRIVSWAWAVLVMGLGVALAVAVALAPSDPLTGFGIAVAVWAGAVNAGGGMFGIRMLAGRSR